MKKLKEELKYGKKGITLISLVVTIIVLLILAGVSINLVLGPNGLISRAQEAALKTGEAEEIEALYMAVADSQIKNLTTQDDRKKNLEESIRAQFGDDVNFSVTDNVDGSFLVSMNDTQRMYYIDETGEIIDQSKMLKISTADELKTFRDDVNDGNTYENWYVYLANDITLDISEEWEPIGLYFNDSSTPDDENNKPFKGIFDGKNHEINGIYINTTDKIQALFGLVSDGVIKNIGIGAKCEITGGRGTAGVVGYAYKKSKIYHCYNLSYISINSPSVGGIVGILNNSYVDNCYNLGKINGNTNVGGIAGYVTVNSKISQSYNAGSIGGNEYYVGGISGYTYIKSSINSCYNIGEIKADKILGGITGYIRDNAYIQNCYSIGQIIGNSNVSGIVGHVNVGEIYNCFYLENTVNNSNDKINREGVLYVTEDELKRMSVNIGEAFVKDLENINNGYPILQWQ